jgi:Tol biopolymer transport system component
MNGIARSRITLAVSCAIAASFLFAPASGQSIDQVTDTQIGVASPAVLSDDALSIFAGASIDPDGTNPLRKTQLFRFDPVTGSPTMITNLDRGLLPASVDLTIALLIGISDDGSRLAFVGVSDPLGTNGNYSPEVFVINSDGTGLAQLTDDPLPNSGSVLRLAFSGDGTRIAFVSNSDLTGGNPNNHANVFVIGSEGAGLAQLTDLPPGNFAGLSISDDGTKLAFSFDGSADYDGDGSSDNTDFSFEVFTLLSDGSGFAQMTDATDYDSIAPMISGDGTKVVFQSNADLITNENNKHQDELFIMDWDGSNLAQITDTRSNLPQAIVGAYAPTIEDLDTDGSGHRIFFFSNDSRSQVNLDQNFEIYKIRSDGTQREVVSDTSFSDGSFIPTVSGDGSRVVFYSFEDVDGTADGRGNSDGSPELYSIDSDGSAALQLTDGVLGGNGDVDLTSDASKIVFSSTADYVGLDPDRGGEIYTMSLDGSGLVQVSNMFSGEARNPSICDDGSLIAFRSDDDIDGTNVDGSFELHLVNGDGSNLRRVTRGPEGKRVERPRITSDCSLVFFDSNSNEIGGNNDDSREIYSVTTDGSLNQTLLTNGEGETQSIRPRVDDSGQWVVFQTNADLDLDGTSGNWEVWRMLADGSSQEKIGGQPGSDFNEPDLSGDGSLIAYSSNADPFGTNPENNFELFLYDTAAMTTTQLSFTTRGEVGKPDFSNDGNWIFFITNSDMFEPDPDNPFHGARMNLATMEIERIGALSSGAVERPVPNQDGSVAVYLETGNPILENYDFSPELFVVDFTDGPIVEIGVSGPAPTVLSLPRWLSGPMRYDFVRGDLSQLASGGPGVTSLGAMTCIENDSMDLDTLGDEDAVDPIPGQGFFYLWRGDVGLNFGQGSYGQSSDGSERTPGLGDCGT